MHDSKTISLIPYLSSVNGFCLDIGRSGIDEVPVGGAPENIFEELFDSDPFCRLMGARIVSDGKSQIKKVFLLIQKDTYLHPIDELRPVTNSEIENYWQRAFKLYTGNDESRACFTLTGQTGGSDQLTALQPLFYCRQKNIYFHPPCPVCGHALHLCRDDKILTGMGLRPYTNSLKRYLYCPFCHDVAGQSDFFTYDLTNTDPSFVNDRWDLIKKLGRLRPDSKSEHIPCPECAEHEKCYGPDDTARSRIQIFNFYPTYMMIFPGDAINAIDFIALVSGASEEQVQHYLADSFQNGRLKCLQASGVFEDHGPYFLFRQSNRFFLEVLYLKLNFLMGLFENIIPDLENLRPPDLGFSLDRFWVTPAHRTGLVPHLWNFTIQRIDLGDAGRQAFQIPKIPPSYGFYFLGTIWFFTLLVNSQQKTSTIYKNLQTILETKINDPETGIDDWKTPLNSPVFSPENIFWNPDETSVPESMHAIWRKTLVTGLQLLTGDHYHGITEDIEKFQQKLTALLETVKGMLLPVTEKIETPAKEKEIKEFSDEDKQALRNILNRIGRKWSVRIEKDSVKPEMVIQKPITDQTVTPEMAPDDPEETITMERLYNDSTLAISEDKASSATISKKKSEFTIKATRTTEEKPICETVILSSGIFKDMDQSRTRSGKKLLDTLSDAPKKQGPIDFFEDHTIVQKPVAMTQKPRSTIKPDFSTVKGLSEADEIEETLILSPADKNTDASLQKDDFAETVIQSPGVAMQKKSKVSDQKNKTEHSPAVEKTHIEDDLAETVILSPRPANRK